MKTDHLDLWQVHDVRTDADVEEIFGLGEPWKRSGRLETRGW